MRPPSTSLARTSLAHHLSRTPPLAARRPSQVEETEVTQDEALAAADIVIAGVPHPKFKIEASKVKPGAIAVNFSQFSNFGEGIEEHTTFVPAIGKVTIAMLERNLHRLHMASEAA